MYQQPSFLGLGLHNQKQTGERKQSFAVCTLWIRNCRERTVFAPQLLSERRIFTPYCIHEGCKTSAAREFRYRLITSQYLGVFRLPYIQG